MYSDTFEETRSRNFLIRLLEDPAGKLMGVLDNTLREPPMWAGKD